MVLILNRNIIIAAILVLIVIFSVMIMTYNTGSIEDAQHNSSSVAYHVNITSEMNGSDLGSVEVIKNVGNPNSKRIAYVVGVHPLEHEVHETLVNILPNMTGLNYCYDIYIINVTKDVGQYGDGLSDSESPGRQNGQQLAYEYVYPEIKNGNYELAIDVHSNVGAYPYQTFVFSPINEGLGADYANEVAQMCQNISYYAPDSTTSGPFLTVPLNENGVPSFYFEDYSFAPQDVKDEHIMELIHAVDSLNI